MGDLLGNLTLGAAAEVPDGATCYFCFDEGLDDDGKPLVRDCSCCGNSAGFAHLSCIRKYTELKCRAAADGVFENVPWEGAPTANSHNCLRCSNT